MAKTDYLRGNLSREDQGHRGACLFGGGARPQNFRKIVFFNFAFSPFARRSKWLKENL